jgi:zinc-ribbon domain/IS66 C-terminal element/Transposase IS66 family
LIERRTAHRTEGLLAPNALVKILFKCRCYGQLLYFENRTCENCFHRLGYLPEENVLSALEQHGSDRTALDAPKRPYRFCANSAFNVCNWLIPADSSEQYCVACRHTRFLDDGRLCMTNNAAERELRAVVMGRKNWTFAGSDEGGRRAAALYTLIATAKLNDIDPQAWLADVLARLSDHPAKRIHELLPWNWRRKITAAEAA